MSPKEHEEEAALAPVVQLDPLGRHVARVPAGDPLNHE